ncbi:MAG: FixH family protein [Gammaproteobacteria bacterium]|jgi:hypothetical protein|nr:FixH family protein [Gammaproteobacteria bacterium]
MRGFGAAARIARIATVGALAAFALSGCGGWSDAPRVQAGEHTVMLKTSPSPAEVGRAATVSVAIRDAEDRSVRACGVSYRQFMPGHEMSTDDVVIQLEEQRSGVYSGTGPEFSMGGDWRIEVSFDCGSGPQQANFDFTLEWPE